MMIITVANFTRSPPDLLSVDPMHLNYAAVCHEPVKNFLEKILNQKIDTTVFEQLWKI